MSIFAYEFERIELGGHLGHFSLPCPTETQHVDQGEQVIKR